MTPFVLTYLIPHRKTQDILRGLRDRDIAVRVMGLPFTFISKHKSLYSVFPKAEDISQRQFCEQLGFEYEELECLPSLENETVLIGGAQLLPKDFVTNNTVINVHGGWLPEVRGLDCLKWAIYENKPIGVTTHIVDQNIDAGMMIDRREVDLYVTDTFADVALRSYNIEIEMIVDALSYNESKLTPLSTTVSTPHRRMKKSDERIMIERLKERVGSL